MFTMPCGAPPINFPAIGCMIRNCPTAEEGLHELASAVASHEQRLAQAKVANRSVLLCSTSISGFLTITTAGFSIHAARSPPSAALLFPQRRRRPPRAVLAIQSFVNGIVMDANAYEGFRYQTEGEIEPGFSYGIKYQIRSATAPAAAPRRRPPLRPSPSGYG